jgi:hypothetical protein
VAFSRFRSSISTLSSPSLKRVILAGGTAVILGSAVVGVAGAQQGPAPTPTGPAGAPPAQTTKTPGAARAGMQQMQQRHDQFLEAVARRLGVSVDRLRQAMTEARAEAGIPDRRLPRVTYSFDVAARAIGITPEQLRQNLTGRSLADVARAQNVDPARVAEALRADAITRIDQAVQNGRITADQATQLKQQVGAQVDQFMNRQMPSREGRGGPRRPGQSGQSGSPA